jgi:hypothetical protein
MSILPSSAADVDRLIRELGSDDVLRRETAAARLSVIGARAVEKLSRVAADTRVTPAARAASLQVLEAIGDPRCLTIAVRVAETDPDDAIRDAAIAVIGSIARGKERAAMTAFEWLTSTALDASLRAERRLAAVSALNGFSERQLAPVYSALRHDSDPLVSARAIRQSVADSISLERLVEENAAVAPTLVSAVVRDEANAAKVTVLRRLVDVLRERERKSEGPVKVEWMSVRGQVHQVLAERGSRLALYDLRESLDRASKPLPVGFLSAAAAIGDASCLAPLAGAWVAAPATDRWWSDHLADAFRSIVKREELTRRDPKLVRILEKWPKAGVLVAAAPRKPRR